MKKVLNWLIVCLCIVGLLGMLSSVSGAESGPGSSLDPVVTQSYVKAQTDALEKELSDLKAENEALRSDLDSIRKDLEALKSGSQEGSQGGSGQPAQTAAAGFVVVEVPNGGLLVGKEGTEMVLRAGSAAAVASKNGGVSDLTAGADLKDGTQIAKNHYLVIPRDDGRGIQCSGLCYVMVKGDYELKQ